MSSAASLPSSSTVPLPLQTYPDPGPSPAGRRLLRLSKAVVGGGSVSGLLDSLCCTGKERAVAMVELAMLLGEEAVVECLGVAGK